MKKLISAFLIAALAISAHAADWPQWRGSNRLGAADETIKPEWPTEGPKELWRATLGAGYSAPAVVGEKLYITGNLKINDELRGHLFAIDTATGKELWRTDYGQEWSKNYPSTRTTPTVVGDKLYFISGSMDVLCLSTEGKIIWRVNMAERFQGKPPMWGYAESPLIYDNKIICHPGGPDATVAALDINGGNTLWTAKLATNNTPDGSTYCSPILLTLHGTRQVVTHTNNHFIGLNADTGQLLWQTPYKNFRGIHPNTPQPIGNDTIAISSGYEFETRLYRINKNTDGSFAAEQLWTTKDADAQVHGIVLHNNVLFSSATKGGMSAIDPKTGQTLYRVKEVEKPSLVKSANRLIAYSEKNGNVYLLDATPEKYTIQGQFPITFGELQHWAHPVIANGKLYIRHGTVLAAYNVK
ncbi:MAG: PQQ-like beta-propeller repeat protein [Phycisphaerales bacterium]|nr:PQQ-like beta-propeller repeat protein [Phycisphaerales bacterium]